MGGCYSCVVAIRDETRGGRHFVRSCVEGPVFDSTRIIWEELAPHGTAEPARMATSV
jgi:hypothetical protein